MPASVPSDHHTPDDAQSGSSPIAGSASRGDSPRRTGSDARYSTLVNAIDVGFCIIEMLFDAAGKPYDYRFLEANPAFERHTGLSGAIGKRMRDLVPDHDAFWFQTYGEVVRTGTSIRFESHALALGRWFDVHAQRVGGAEEGTVGVFFTDITARKADQIELEQLYAAARTRAEHEALLNQIGAAVRATREPDAIFQAAVTALGQGLGADRCYFVRYNQARDRGVISPEWFREGVGLEPIAGLSRQMSSYSVNRDVAFAAGQTQVVEDTVAFAPEAAAPLLALKVRALLRVPIAVGNQMTALGVAMSFAPRRWTEDEVRLVESVATLVRAALESAYVQQRERNIAQQLQEALVPVVPEAVPGMRLCGFYRAALEESGVGGDFSDVFTGKEGGLTCLVVADLSGKGLAAASQVATVRNMLRYALHADGSLARAVTRLNRVLVEQELITGFATLFVGMYDPETGRLTYVNCGQEPGLVCRASTNTIEWLSPTGPVLGGFVTGEYREGEIVLTPGDVLALFTDGLTEVGPSRKNFLEIEGVSELLRECCAAPPARVIDPQAVVDCLIAGIDAYAQDEGVRDDLALLVGVVTERTGL